MRDLYRGFIERFGDTDCKTLTGCDWSLPEDRKRYYRGKVYQGTCYRQLEYVLGACLEEGASA